MGEDKESKSLVDMKTLKLVWMPAGACHSGEGEVYIRTMTEFSKWDIRIARLSSVKHDKRRYWITRDQEHISLSTFPYWARIPKVGKEGG